jgi:hypothetical protein
MSVRADGSVEGVRWRPAPPIRVATKGVRGVSNFKLNLPTDIPWRRKCVSKDMIDLSADDAVSPFRWRSSIAIFEYEPEEADQNYAGMTISYVKVACTITGYQENPKEIGIPYRSVRSYWKNAPGIEDYLTKLQAYYACFGAVLEVTVHPEDAQPNAEFPFFMDFEPKKRELYQLATDTNERQSRSIESLNVTKSAGSTQSLETFDIDMGGGGFGAQASVAGTGGGFNYQAPNGQWGTKRLNADETLSSRTSDVGQEKRETFSFSTQLSQLYHQLDSYHLGTNRALFFVLPRPHTLETEHTFVNGLRNIEGIQEFFLVVARPKEQTGVCIEAYLETGHIGKRPRLETQEIPGTELHTTWSDQYQARPLGNDDETTVFDGADRFWVADTYYPGQGYRIKDAVFSSPGGKITYNYDRPNLVDEHPHISDQNPDYIKVSGRVHSGFANHAVGSDRWEEITYPFTVAITLVKTKVVELSTDTLFMTGRHLNCCENDRFKRSVTASHGIVYERELPNSQAGPQDLGVHSANQRVNFVQDGIRQSTNDPDHRYETPVRLAHTDFASRALLGYLPGTTDIQIAELPHLSSGLRRKLNELRHDVTVADLLSMPLKMQQDLFAMSVEEVAELRNALTGASAPIGDPRDAWLTSSEIERLFSPSDLPTYEEGSGASGYQRPSATD